MNNCNLTGGTLDIGISGPTSYGRIIFAGDILLAGTFDTALQNGFLPSPGEVFTVLNYPAASGAFSCLSLDLGGGFLLQPQFSGTGLTLTVATYATNASQPKLFINPTLGGVAITWPPGFPGWVLQFATNLHTTNWIPVSVACGNQAVVPVAAQQQFFRLQNGN